MLLCFCASSDLVVYLALDASLDFYASSDLVVYLALDASFDLDGYPNVATDIDASYDPDASLGIDFFLDLDAYTLDLDASFDPDIFDSCCVLQAGIYPVNFSLP